MSYWPDSQTPGYHRAGGYRPTRPDPPAARLVRIRGRVLIVDRRANNSPDEASTAPLDPHELGIEDDELFKSVVLRIAETGSSANVTEAGSFLLETDLPGSVSVFTLCEESAFLMPEDGKQKIQPQLGERSNSRDIDIEMRMIPAINMRPTYNGTPIRPRDLENALVRDEFLRQTSELVSRIMKPPNEKP